MVRLALRILIATALTVDAVVHLRLASNYQLAAPDGIGAGNVFRIEATLAIAAAVYVLVRGSRPAFIVAGIITITAFAAVLVYRYVDVPPLGPIPGMYEPVWFTGKTVSAIAEGLGAVLAGIAIMIVPRRHGGKRHITDASPRPPWTSPPA